MRATPITARPVTASAVGARSVIAGQSLTERLPWLFDFTAPMTALPPALQAIGATYTRNSEKRVVQNGALVTLAANQFGTSYDDVTGLYGYVPEPAATNLCVNSQDLSGVLWNNFSTSDTQAAGIAPDGTNTANKLLETTDSTMHFIGNSSFTSWANATAYTLSVFAKASELRYLQLTLPSESFNDNGRRAIFDVQGGVVTASETGVTALIHNIGNGWYRCRITATTDAAGGGGFNLLLASSATGYNQQYAGSTGNGLLVWGIQLETGSRATSYIPTTGSTASRAADVLTIPIANLPGFNAAGYTLFADLRRDAVASDAYAVQIGTLHTDAARLMTSGASGNTSCAIYKGGVLQADTVAKSAIGVSRAKIAASIAANSLLVSGNGAAGPIDSSLAMPPAASFYIGSAVSGTAQYNGFIFRAGLIPKALTQAQINALTVI